MVFTAQQQYYLKRLAALHGYANQRKAVYLHQEREKAWTANDLADVSFDAGPLGVLMYKGKQYDNLEGIVADVLGIHEDANAMLQINNCRIACGRPAFMTMDHAETLDFIPGDPMKRKILTCKDYLDVYGISFDDVCVMQRKRVWTTKDISLEAEPTDSWISGKETRTVVVPVDDGSEMDAYYRILVSLGEGLLKEDHRKIKWGEARVAPDVRTLFHIWEDRPGLDMTVGFTEFNVPEEVAGNGKSGDYMMSVRAVGSKDSNGVMQYQASVSVFLECVKVGVFDYPFENDGLTSLTTAPNASENWTKLFDYVRFAKPMSESTTAQQGA